MEFSSSFRQCLIEDIKAVDEAEPPEVVVPEYHLLSDEDLMKLWAVKTGGKFELKLCVICEAVLNPDEDMEYDRGICNDCDESSVYFNSF